MGIVYPKPQYPNTKLNPDLLYKAPKEPMGSHEVFKLLGLIVAEEDPQRAQERTFRAYRP